MSLENKKLFWSGTIAATLYWLLSEMLSPIISLYAVELNFSNFQISVIFAAQTFVPFLLTIQIGYIADLIGQKKVIAIGASLMIIGSAMLQFSSSFFTLLIVQTFVGVGHIAVWLASQSIVTLVDGKYREKAIAKMSFCTALGQLIGPLLAGLILEITSFKSSFGIYLLISITLFLVCIFIPKNINQNINKKGSEPITFFEPYRKGGELYVSNRGIQIATMISFSLAFILYIRVTYLPIFLENLGYGPTIIGVFIALWSVASMMIRLVSDKLMNLFGRLKTTSGALFVSILGLAGFTLLPNTSGLILSIILIGIGTGLNQPLAISLVSTATNSLNRGLGMGLRLMANRMAMWICPLSFGATTSLISLKLTFLVLSIPLAVISYHSTKSLEKYNTIADKENAKKALGV